jgi:hypothetical protein
LTVPINPDLFSVLLLPQPRMRRCGRDRDLGRRFLQVAGFLAFSGNLDPAYRDTSTLLNNG